ncbi:MAG TPA: hypothetical protein VF043_10105 [Ktedonobacteraceae bacterium]
MQRSGSVWAQTPVFIRILSAIIFMVGFPLLLWAEYLYGNKRYDVSTKVFSAMMIPGFLGASLVYLSAGLVSLRQEHVAWYNQRSLLRGIGFFCVFLSALVLAGVDFNLLPDLVGNVLVTPLFLLWIACLIWSFIIGRRDKRRSEEEWLRDG